MIRDIKPLTLEHLQRLRDRNRATASFYGHLISRMEKEPKTPAEAKTEPASINPGKLRPTPNKKLGETKGEKK